MKFLKYVCLALLSAMISGCGDTDDGPSKSSNAEPKVADNARFVMLYRNNDCAALEAMSQPFKECIEKSMRKNGDTFSEYEEFLKTAGLKDNEVKWGLISIGDLDFEALKRNPSQVPLSAVVCVKHDSKKLLDELVKSAQKDGNDSVDEDEIEGERVLLIDVGGGFNGMRFYYASLNDELIVVTTTKTEFRNQVALYRDGKKGSGRFRGFLDNRENVIGFAASDLGALCEEIENKTGEEIDSETPFGFIDVKKFKDLEVGVKVKGSSLEVGAELSMASAKSAEEFDSILKQALKMMLNQMGALRGQSEESDAVLEILESADIKLLGSKATATFRIPEKMIKLALEKYKRVLP